MKLAYMGLALLGSAVCQFLVLIQTERAIAAGQTTGVIRPPESYYILNVVLASAAMLLALLVLRSGRWWQRLIGGVFCLYPLTILVITVNGAIRLLIES